MLGLTQLIEKEFQDNWVDTPLHISGFKFDSKGLDEWVRIQTTPLNDEIMDVSGNCDKQEIILEIFCYAKTKYNALTISDNIKLFLNNSTLDKKTNISFGVESFETNSWLVTMRVVIFDTSNIAPISYLVDGLGNFLTDDAGNFLIV